MWFKKDIGFKTLWFDFWVYLPFFQKSDFPPTPAKLVLAFHVLV